jgi:hypothetical protein
LSALNHSTIAALPQSITRLSPDRLHPSQAFKVLISHSGSGRYETRDTAGNLIVSDVREPFFESARVLLARGFDPDTLLLMARVATPDRIDMRARLGRAAGLTVSNNSTRTPTLPGSPPPRMQTNERPDCLRECNEH